MILKTIVEEQAGVQKRPDADSYAKLRDPDRRQADSFLDRQ